MGGVLPDVIIRTQFEGEVSLVIGREVEDHWDD